MDEFIDHASDPHQYDRIDWSNEGALDSPQRLLYQNIMSKHIGDASAKSILDIGSGTGTYFLY